MAVGKMFMITIAIIAIVAPSALAKEFVVGDDKGWTVNFDYQTWAAGKDFRVGDKLIFKYTEGAHNVFRVDGKGFQQCAAPAETEALATGNDVITLATPEENGTYAVLASTVRPENRDSSSLFYLNLTHRHLHLCLPMLVLCHHPELPELLPLNITHGWLRRWDYSWWL